MPFEILEAGTGHGSLTLHLSRAIHSFNGLRPISPELYHSSESLPEDSASSGASETRPLNFSPEDLESYEKWRSGRRAILHSLEASPKHLEHAKGVVQGFNFGLYSGNVDFHSASLRPWLSSLSKERPAPFLSHAILDLPQVSEELEGVARAMLANGTVIVFVPSITQIVKCAQLVKERDIPLYLDDVLELGSGAGTGGRQWNVKAVKPRALLKAEAEARLRLQEEDSAEQNRFDQDESAESEDGDTGDGGAGGGWEMICRPKAFGRIVGGGFVGIWKRNRDFK
jgi:tRNA (adenine57-N1/adenine58-N1)-methyltransferase